MRLTDTTEEVLHQGQRVASHARSPRRGGYTTVAAHMPESYQRYLISKLLQSDEVRRSQTKPALRARPGGRGRQQ